MKLLLTVLTLTLVINSPQANVTIDSFGYSLERIDRLFSHYTFETAFKCGDKARFQAAKNMCETICRPTSTISEVCEIMCVSPFERSEMVDQEIVNCTKNQVTIFSSDGDIRTITRQQFLQHKKNPLREIIQQLPLWTEGVHHVHLYFLTQVEHTLGWKTDNERKVPAWQFFARVDTSVGSHVSQDEYIFTVIDDPSIPWFARASRVRMEQEGTMWRLHDL